MTTERDGFDRIGCAIVLVFIVLPIILILWILTDTYPETIKTLWGL